MVVIKRASSLNFMEEADNERDLLDIVGGDGPWQLRIFIIMMIAIIPAATQTLSISFLAPNVDHWCAKPAEMTNMSLEKWRQFGLPDDDKQCYRYDNLTYVALMVHENHTDKNSLKSITCHSWDYDDTFYQSTVLSQWNLVCDKEWLVSLSKSIFMAGILVGVFGFGYLSDKVGRRPTISLCCFLMVSSAFICVFSVNVLMFIITRFFIAIGVGGYYNVFFVLLMEISSPEMRTVYGIAVQFGWCIGYVCLPGIAYIIKDFFWLQMALTLPCLPLLGIWWIIPESPRWLLSNGRVNKARAVLEDVVRINLGIKTPKREMALNNLMEKAIEVRESGESKGNCLHLLTTPVLWKITLNVYFLWFVNAFVYFGLSFNTNDLSGDPYLNFFLFGLVEFPAYFLSIFALRWFGRRRPLATIMIVAGVSCVLTYFLPQEPDWLLLAVSVFCKFCITSSFGIVYVYTTELFPTVLRNTGLGSASLVEGIGSIIAPFAKELGDATYPVVPLVLIGVLALSSGLAVLLLPETHNCVVPNTLKEAAEASRWKKKIRREVPLLSTQERSAEYINLPSPEYELDTKSSIPSTIA